MAGKDHRYPYPVVVLAAGDFPTHPIPLGILGSAGTLVCTDGSAGEALRNGLSPDVIIGDMDSLNIDQKQLKCEIVHHPGQDNTDLEKALDWCVEAGLSEVTVIAGTGGREDHTFANLLLMIEYAPGLHINTVTDYFAICYVDGHQELKSQPGQKVSLIAVKESPLLTTCGLAFRLRDEPLRTPGHGIANQATNDSFAVTVRNGGVLVFIAHKP